MAAAAASTEWADESEYERQRRENIAANARLLLSLGLDTAALTQQALGSKAPLRQKARRVARERRPLPPPVDPSLCRRSSRLEGADPVSYKESQIGADGGGAVARSDVGRPAKRPRQMGNPTAIPPPDRAAGATAGNPRSCKFLRADVSGLKDSSLGRIIPPLGGQVKRAAMEALSAEGPPTFSRMSGIQEWENAVALFVNIYGDGYKNVFLKGGREITWFGQNSQWEGSPVLQRLIHSGGAEVTHEDGSTTVYPVTPVVLFCRIEGSGYVYCGELQYVAHEPERLPLRFVWALADHAALATEPDFGDVLTACTELVGTEVTDDT